MTKISIVAIFLALMGCGSRLQPQVIADTRAASLSVAVMPDGPDRQRLYEYIARSVVAMTDDMPLPEPSQTPEEIAADPETFISDTEDSEADPPEFTYLTDSTPGVRNRLREEGEYLVSLGKWVAISGLVLSLLGWAYGLLGWTFLGWIGKFLVAPVVAPILRLTASLGCCTVGLGFSMIWLADYWWWFFAALMVCGAGFAVYHYHDLARIYAKVKTGLLKAISEARRMFTKRG